MLRGKKFITVLTVITVCMTVTAGFTTQAASMLPEAVAIEHTDKKIVVSDFVAGTTETETKEARKTIEKAKADYEAEQKRIAEEKKREEEARLAAEAAKKAEEEAAAAEAAEAQEIQMTQSPAVQASAGDLELLASIIFCEAGNQPYEGQVAVGAVIMNRVRSGVYPGSIGEVIYQSGQFGPAMTGWLDTVLSSGGYTDAAMQAASDAMAGVNPIGDCLYFGNGDYGIQIGDHFFH